MPEDGLVTLELRDEIALVGLNRPKKCNAIDEQMAIEMANALSAANDKAKVGIIYGHGNHFSSGLDLEWMRSRILESAAAHDESDRSPKNYGPMHLISRANIPYIAAIQGGAIGLGLELAAATHIRVADETAFFELPEARRGIFVGGGGSARISRLIGVARMQDMMLTGRRYSAAESLQCGMVQYVVSEGTALRKALELANGIKKNASASNFAILKALPRLGDLPFDDGIFWEGILAKTTFSRDVVTRMSAFLDGSRGEPDVANGKASN